MWCSGSRLIDERVLIAYRVSNVKTVTRSVSGPGCTGDSRRPFDRVSDHVTVAGPDVKHHSCQVISYPASVIPALQPGTHAAVLGKLAFLERDVILRMLHSGKPLPL